MATIGPGAGGLMAGLAWGKIRNAQDSENEMAEELAKTRERLMRASAGANASQSVTNAIVTELADEAAGTLKVRRLSDPKNRTARVQFHEDVEEAELTRLSGGKLTLKRETKRGRRP